MSLLFALLALAAQATETAPPEPYRALGAGPFWNAWIGDHHMGFETPGRDIVSVPAPPRQETGTGFVYRTAGFAISVEHGSCTDPHSRRLFSDRVTVRVGGTDYAGCGGRSLSPPSTAYSAAGGEPIWWLDLADGRLAYQIDHRVIIIPLPAPRSTRTGSLRVYEAAGIRVAIRPQDCELDDGVIYADSVTVTAGGRTVQGCGGRIVRGAPED